MMMPRIFGESLFDEMMDFPFNHSFFKEFNHAFDKQEKGLAKTDVKEKDRCV